MFIVLTFVQGVLGQPFVRRLPHPRNWLCRHLVAGAVVVPPQGPTEPAVWSAPARTTATRGQLCAKLFRSGVTPGSVTACAPQLDARVHDGEPSRETTAGASWRHRNFYGGKKDSEDHITGQRNIQVSGSPAGGGELGGGSWAADSTQSSGRIRSWRSWSHVWPRRSASASFSCSDMADLLLPVCLQHGRESRQMIRSTQSRARRCGWRRGAACVWRGTRHHGWPTVGFDLVREFGPRGRTPSV